MTLKAAEHLEGGKGRHGSGQVIRLRVLLTLLLFNNKLELPP